VERTRNPAGFIAANFMTILILAILLFLIIMVYIDIGELMILVLVFPASFILIILGFIMFRIGKSFPALLLNKLMPFISVAALTVSTGFANSKNEIFIGIPVDITLIILVVVTGIISLRRGGNQKKIKEKSND
jgi:hypothetical protein